MDKSKKYRVMRFLFLVVFISFSNISFASFPVNEMDVVVNESVEVPTYNNSWYISVKNSLLFLATSFVGLAFLKTFINEAFLVSDFQGWGVIFLLLLATPAFFASVFYGKKIWGSSIRDEDKLSKKIVIWIVSIFALIILIGNLIYAGGMGG